MRDKEQDLIGAGGQALAAAVTSVLAQQEFAPQLEAGFPMVSDWNRVATPAYGVQYDVWREHSGVAKRSVFVIDRQRIVRYRWVTNDARVLPDFDAAIDAIRSLGSAG